MAKSYEELLADITGIIAKIYEKGYDKGYEQGKFSAQLDRIDGMSAEELTKEVQQEKRDRIIEKAKKDIETLQQTGKIRTIRGIDGLFHTFYPNEYDYVDFVINKQKRTVVALFKRKFDDVVWAKGIAKAHPNDCFNVHIGKAIALRRALGLEVPGEYLNAPQPTEVRVGDVMNKSDNKFGVTGTRKIVGSDEEVIFGKTAHKRSFFVEHSKIIDDSRDGEDG